MAAPPLPVFTVRDGIIACGVRNDDSFDGRSSAERIADELFDDDFQMCMDKSIEDLKSDFKSYTDLTVAQGQIRLMPGAKRNIQAFIQFIRDEICQDRDPSTIGFNSIRSAEYQRRYNAYARFFTKSKTLSEAAKPKHFTSTTKWVDWAPSFVS